MDACCQRVATGLKHGGVAPNEGLRAIGDDWINAETVDSLLVVIGNAVIDDVSVVEGDGVISLRAVAPGVDLDVGAEGSGLEIDRALVISDNRVVRVDAIPVVVKNPAIGAEAVEVWIGSEDAGLARSVVLIFGGNGRGGELAGRWIYREPANVVQILALGVER